MLESYDNYEIIGREYERIDGTRTLVLARIMATNMVEGADPVTCQLPGTYRTVQPDLSLGDPVTQLELVNNDGVILVKHQD